MLVMCIVYLGLLTRSVVVLAFQAIIPPVLHNAPPYSIKNIVPDPDHQCQWYFSTGTFVSITPHLEAQSFATASCCIGGYMPEQFLMGVRSP